MRIAECLYNLVSLRGVCETDDPNTLFVNDLPGVDLDLFENLTSPAFKTKAEVFSRIEKTAIHRLYNSVNDKLSGRFEIRSIVSGVETGVWRQPFSLLQAENNLTGVYIDLRGSRNLHLTLDHVKLYVGNPSGFPINSAIHIYDLETGQKVGEQAFTASQEGFIRVEINKRYLAKRIFVCYDSSEIQSYRTDEHTSAYLERFYNNYACSLSGSGVARIAKGQQMIYDNVSFEGTSGMIANYTVGCSLENWMCENRERLRQPLLYLMGIELAENLIVSPRVNEGTLDSDRVDGIAAYCNTQFNSSLDSFLRGVRIDDPICTKCKSKVKKRIMLP